VDSRDKRSKHNLLETLQRDKKNRQQQREQHVPLVRAKATPQAEQEFAWGSDMFNGFIIII